MDSLSAFIPMDRRLALAAGLTLPDRARGTVLFADISGFTPLTQSLAEELGRQRGPEELTRLLNRVYNPLIEAIHRYGGSVVGFAGDAITCWFDRDGGPRAVASAETLQEIMQDLGTVITPGGSRHTLAIKVAIVAGPVRRFVVGDPSVQLIDVLAGETVDRVALGEHLAQPGEVLVHQDVAAEAGARLVVSEWRIDPASGERFGIAGHLSTPVVPCPWPEPPPLDPDVARRWVLPPLIERFAHGETPFTAELRTSAPLFIKFSGIDYDEEDAAGQKLDAYIRWVQTVLDGYEGFLFQLTMGDKGSYLYAALGSPIAHDDDPSRAVAAALRLRTPPPELQYVRGVQIGITTGQVRAGAYGASSCRTFGMQGNEVNMAARLMSKAMPGQILVSRRVAERAGRHFRFNALGAVALKGSSEPVQIAEVVGPRSATEAAPALAYSTPLVGRETLLAAMASRLHDAMTGHGQVLRLEGAAGIGKSHLAAAFSREARAQGWQVTTGASQSTTRSTAYFPWHAIFRSLLEPGREDWLALPTANAPSLEPSTIEDVAAGLARSIEGINPEWLPRLPLLGDLLGLPFPENPITSQLEPRLRQEAVFDLAVDVVRTLANRQPQLLVLEDIHWMDEVSVELATAIARAIGDTRAALLLVHRPPVQSGSPAPAASISELLWHTAWPLAELTPESVAVLAERLLDGPVAALVLALIQIKSQGNPFFVEELVSALREAGALEPQADGKWQLAPQVLDQLRSAACLTRVGDEWAFVPNARLADAALDIPDTIQDLVQSRIDRLPDDSKLTLRVASVIGGTFELGVLQGAHPASPPLDDLERQIETMTGSDFIRLDSTASRPTYMFRHHTTHEVAYETLLFSQRRQLHRAVAEWYEGSYLDAPLDRLTPDSALAPYYPLLVHHWNRAEDLSRERLYAAVAGDQAARQYANVQAITYYSRALELADAADLAGRYELIKKRATVYGWQGQRAEQAQSVDALDALARELHDGQRQAEAAWWRADLARVTGNYDAALESVQQASTYASQAGDPELLVRSHALWGRILWRQNRYTEAQTHLEQALSLAEQLKDQHQMAQCHYTLGNNAYYQDRYADARAEFEQAYAIYQELSDRQGQINCLHMFGALQYRLRDYMAGQHTLEQALALSREVGWRMNEAYILGNLANVYFDLGVYDEAEVHHLHALAICREIGDREGEAASLDTLGLIEHSTGDSLAALRYHEQAASIHREIGSLRGLGYALSHAGHAWLEVGDPLAAGEVYAQSLALRRRLGEDTLAIDDLAGLAEVALATGDLTGARAGAEEVLAWLSQNGITGIEFPARVYLTCYRVLSAKTVTETSAEPDRARHVLSEGYRRVEEEAARIPDEALRAGFLRNVPDNREILAAWRRLSAA